MVFYFKDIFIFLDAAKRWQVFFQDPATVGMNSLIDLHHDIMFFLLLILGVVTYLLVILLQEHIITFDLLEGSLPTEITHNTFLELVWTILPSLILFVIAIPSFSLLYILEELQTPLVSLKVVGHQWYWTYEYHDPRLLPSCESLLEECRLHSTDELQLGHYRLLETDPYLFLPTDTNIRVLITSDDVIHSWAVPSFAIKVDAVPGRLNQVFMNILREGFYYGQCSEICGINHGFMPIAIRSMAFTHIFDLLDEPEVMDDDVIIPIPLNQEDSNNLPQDPSSNNTNPELAPSDVQTHDGGATSSDTAVNNPVDEKNNNTIASELPEISVVPAPELNEGAAIDSSNNKNVVVDNNVVEDNDSNAASTTEQKSTTVTADTTVEKNAAFLIFCKFCTSFKRWRFNQFISRAWC